MKNYWTLVVKRHNVWTLPMLGLFIIIAALLVIVERQYFKDLAAFKKRSVVVQKIFIHKRAVKLNMGKNVTLLAIGKTDFEKELAKAKKVYVCVDDYLSSYVLYIPAEAGSYYSNMYPLAEIDHYFIGIKDVANGFLIVYYKPIKPERSPNIFVYVVVLLILIAYLMLTFISAFYDFRKFNDLQSARDLINSTFSTD